MTGSVAETEDILQQAWLRFAGQDLAALESPARWLTTVVSHLSLDHLKSARRQRETYVGAWLPEPLLESPDPTPEQQWMVTEDVSIALILLLDTLSPEMRAAFLLRDAFDYGFDEIAQVVGRSPATCRQLVSRARKRLAGAEPPAAPSLEEARPIIAPSGKPAARATCSACWRSSPRISRCIPTAAARCRRRSTCCPVRAGPPASSWGLPARTSCPSAPAPPLRRINGAPGFVSVDPAGVMQTTAVSLRNGRIAALWIVRNPDKLRHLSGATG